MLYKLSELESIVKSKNRLVRMGLVSAADPDSLQALFKAREKGVVEPILFGEEVKICQLCEEYGISLKNITIIDQRNDDMAAACAIDWVRQGKIEALMKGSLSTASYLRPLLKKENQLVDGLLSHIALFEMPSYPKLLMVTDAALNIKPSLTEKIQIIRNSEEFCHRLGYQEPKIAYICAVEKINPEKMPETEEAAILSQMARRHQLGSILFDGPLALDNAVSPHSMAIKKIESPVGGDADLLLMPEIISANVLYKSLACLAQAKVAASIIGARVPVVLTSRADNEESKFYSILLAIAVSG